MDTTNDGVVLVVGDMGVGTSFPDIQNRRVADAVALGQRTRRFLRAPDFPDLLIRQFAAVSYGNLYCITG